jgi:hypothetical protein
MNKKYTICVIPQYFSEYKFLSNFSFNHQTHVHKTNFSNQTVLSQSQVNELSKQSAISKVSFMPSERNE